MRWLQYISHVFFLSWFITFSLHCCIFTPCIIFLVSFAWLWYPAMQMASRVWSACSVAFPFWFFLPLKLCTRMLTATMLSNGLHVFVNALPLSSLSQGKKIKLFTPLKVETPHRLTNFNIVVMWGYACVGYFSNQFFSTIRKSSIVYVYPLPFRRPCTWWQLFQFFSTITKIRQLWLGHGYNHDFLICCTCYAIPDAATRIFIYLTSTCLIFTVHH